MSDTFDPDMTADDITRSTRDRELLRERLRRWVAERLVDAELSELVAPSNGMSSETLLFDLTWIDADAPQGRASGGFAARIEPEGDAVPVFPSYDLDAQQRVMRLVGTHTDAPVPAVRWFEPDPGVLGGAFFVMDRVEGRVPPDVLPYTMDGFVLALDGAERRRMQDGTVDALTMIHEAPVGEAAAFLDHGEGPTSLHRHLDRWRSYHRWVVGERTVPVLDEALVWLEANWPEAAAAREPVVSWGDARIGNVIYGDDLAPAAVLDWEMASIAPREVDLGWMSFLHTFFQDITEEYGMDGLPDMLRLDDVAARYEQSSGIAPLDLGWFEVYAAYRHGVIMVRVHDRQVHFGEVQPVEDPDAAVMHRTRLRQLIST